MRSRGAMRVALVVVAAGMATGCATVKQDEFQREVGQIRAEMARQGTMVNSRIDGLEDRMGEMDARLDALNRELTGLESELDAQVQRFEASLRFVTPIQFAFDDASVNPEGRRILTRFAAVVMEVYPGALVTVEGFTDPAGSESYNLILGQRRADAVRSILVDAQGLAADQVRAVSYGEDTRRLVDPGASGPGQTGAANRRVALVVEHPGGSRASMVTQDGS